MALHLASWVLPLPPEEQHGPGPDRAIECGAGSAPAVLPTLPNPAEPPSHAQLCHGFGKLREAVVVRPTGLPRSQKWRELSVKQPFLLQFGLAGIMSAEAVSGRLSTTLGTGKSAAAVAASNAWKLHFTYGNC